MNKKEKRKKFYFTTLDLVYIALFAGIGIAIKPVTASIAGIIRTIIPLPGGSLLGIVYTFIIFTGAGLVKKTGAISLIGIIQAILVNLIGFGSHGGLSLITFTLPCFFSDFISYLTGKLNNIISYILAGGAFNSFGALLVIFLYQRATPTLLLILICGGLSFIMGAIGGALSYLAVNIIEETI